MAVCLEEPSVDPRDEDPGLQPMSEGRAASLTFYCHQLETKLLVNNFISDLRRGAPKGFLSEHEIEDVSSLTSNTKRIRRLIDILKGKDNAAFERFCAILESAGYGHWTRELLQKAGLDYTEVQDSLSLPLKRLNDALLKKKELFVPGKKALEQQFIKLTASFEGYVHDFSEKKFVQFRRTCSGFLRSYDPCESLAPAPSLPDSKIPLLDNLNARWNFIDIRLLSDLIDMSDQADLLEELAKYKHALDAFSNQCLSCLETRVHEISGSIRSNDPESNGKHIIAIILSKYPTLKEIFKIKEFLVDSLHLEDAKFLGFDSGCTVLFFNVSCVGTSPNPRSLSVHALAQVKEEFSVSRLVCLGVWAIDIAHGSIPEQSLLIFSGQPNKAEVVNRTEFDEIAQEVRQLKDQVVNLKLKLKVWQMEPPFSEIGYDLESPTAPPQSQPKDSPKDFIRPTRGNGKLLRSTPVASRDRPKKRPGPGTSRSKSFISSLKSILKRKEVEKIRSKSTETSDDELSSSADHRSYHSDPLEGQDVGDSSPLPCEYKEARQQERKRYHVRNCSYSSVSSFE